MKASRHRGSGVMMFAPLFTPFTQWVLITIRAVLSAHLILSQARDTGEQCLDSLFTDKYWVGGGLSMYWSGWPRPRPSKLGQDFSLCHRTQKSKETLGGCRIQRTLLGWGFSSYFPPWTSQVKTFSASPGPGDKCLSLIRVLRIPKVETMRP